MCAFALVHYLLTTNNMDNIVSLMIMIMFQYRIMGIVCGRKHSQILRIWKHSQTFSCTFYLGRDFYIWDCLNCEGFLANYGKEGNSWNFSSADDSRYTVYSNLIYQSLFLPVKINVIQLHFWFYFAWQQPYFKTTRCFCWLLLLTNE